MVFQGNLRKLSNHFDFCHDYFQMLQCIMALTAFFRMNYHYIQII